jgi:hypothetical protein
MAKPITFLVDAAEPLAELAGTLNHLLDIHLIPLPESGDHYAFRAMTLTLDLQEVQTDKAQLTPNQHRYQIIINGIFGSEEQRTKWTEDWAFGILQTLRETGRYRVRRADAAFAG